MRASDIISRVREHGLVGLSEQDRNAFAYRPGCGRVVRRELVDALLGDHSAADLPLLRELMREEITARSEHGGGGRVLFGLALMLFELANIEDVLLMHSAKYCNMDAGSMLDRRLLTMQRDKLTVRSWIQARLRQSPSGSIWPVERVLSDVDAAFAHAAGSGDEDWVRAAWHELHTAYGEDLFDEDSEED